MVNLRRPTPPAAPDVGRPVNRAKDYSERPSEVTSELDDLRNRGIAKGLNRHFTDTAKKIAKEKAAADAALADLERRRANKSEFKPTHGTDLNPFDALYVELQSKRAECRRKEKETMLLYQRYVHKYGKKAKVAAPAKEDLSMSVKSAASSPSKKLSSPAEAVERSVPSTPEKKAPLQPLEEKSVDSTVEEKKEANKEEDDAALQDVNFSRFYKKQISERALRAHTGGVDPPADPPGMNVTIKKADSGEETNNTASIPDLKTLTPRTSQETEEEKKVVAASKKPDPDEGGDSNRSDSMSDGSGERPTALVTTCTEMPSATTTTDGDDEEDSDDRSIISGLTNATPFYKAVLEDVEHEMEDFLKTETLAVQKMLDMEEERSVSRHSVMGNMSFSGHNSVYGDESVRCAAKAEAMAAEMQKILDDFQKDDKSVSTYGFHGDGADVSERGEEDSTVVSSTYPRKYPTAVPDEEWMVYFDEANQREYYHEKVSNRTQWHPPGKSLSRGTSSGSDGLQGYRSRLTRKKSRKEIYRRKLRKRRMRRMVILSFVALCGAATVFHWQTKHPQKTYPGAMQATFSTLKENAQNLAIQIKDKYEYTFTDRLKREETQKEKELRERLEREKKAEEARKAREKAEREEKKRLAEQKAKEMLALQKSKEEAERKAAEMKRLAEERARREALERQRLEAVRIEMERREAESKEAERIDKERREAERLSSARRLEEETRRPWGCHVPLAYVVNKRCRRLSKLNPMYDEKDLINSFLL